jgi:hypothetical protein
MAQALDDLRKWREGPQHKIILSVDLGKRRDHTAFSISETKPELRKNKRQGKIYVMTVTVRDLQQLPLNTDYTDVAQRVHDVFWDERLWLRDGSSGKSVGPTLLVDAGGVGDAVADDLAKDLGVPFVRYRLVRGTAQENRHSKLDYTVPRTIMFQQLYAAFQSDRIRLPRHLKHTKTLLAELRGLQVERNEETGYIRVVHRENEHDDLAICVAASNWWANRKQKGTRRLRVINDERTALRLMGYDPGFIAKHTGGASRK